MITGSNLEVIIEAKEFLKTQFHMKDMNDLKYFLGIEVDRTEAGIFLSQKKYIEDILKEYGLLGCKALKLPMDTYVKLTHNAGSIMEHPEAYQRLIRETYLLNHN